MNYLFIFFNSIFILSGLIFFDWNATILSFAYLYEIILLSAITFLTVKKNGGNKLLYRLLPVDANYYIKQQAQPGAGPFFFYGFILACFTLALALNTFKLMPGFETVRFYSVSGPLLVMTIAYVFKNKKVVINTNIDQLSRYMTRPILNLFAIYVGLIVGMLFIILTNSSIASLAGIVVAKSAIEFVDEKYVNTEINIKLLRLFGVRMRNSAVAEI